MFCFETGHFRMIIIETFVKVLCESIMRIRTFVCYCSVDLSGEMTQDVTRQEMVTLLSMSDRTHSQLIDSFPEKCGLSGQAKDFEQVLKTASLHLPV